MALQRSENHRVTRAAGVVGLATLFSRLLGFLRDALVAYFLGAGFATDTFFTAFRVPSLMRRLFAEGSLSVSFVPVFMEQAARHGQPEAFEMARSAFRISALVLLGGTVLGLVGAPLIVKGLAPGFIRHGAQLALTVRLTRIMLPYIFFVGLAALSMGILNALGHFASPAFAPAVLNLSIIGCLLFVSPHLSQPVYGLAMGVVAGGVLQLLLQLPALLQKRFFLWQKARLCHPALKQVARKMLPVVFGLSVYQINIVVGNLLASTLARGSISYLYYADRLVQFPMGLFGMAAATAVLPSLSRQAAAGDLKALVHTFQHTMKLVTAIILPAMIGLIILRRPIVALLFQRGAFGLQSVRLTAGALLYYGMGLWAFSTVRIVVMLFYALQDTATPVRTAVIAIAFNAVCGVVLMRWMGYGGLALAASLASALNLGLLVHALKQKIGLRISGKQLVFYVKSTVCALGMGVGVWNLARMLPPGVQPAPWKLLLGVCGCISAGVILYSILFLAVNPSEMHELRAFVRKSRAIR